MGTAKPHRSVAAGFAASLTPKAVPCRRAGMLPAIAALEVSWAMPLTRPQASSAATSMPNDPVTAAIAAATTAVAMAARRKLRRGPIRSTKRPSGAESSACEMKHADSARPSAEGPTPKSARIWGPSAPTR